MQGAGCRVQGAGLRACVEGLGFGVWGLGVGRRVLGVAATLWSKGSIDSSTLLGGVPRRAPFVASPGSKAGTENSWRRHGCAPPAHEPKH
jgi:hypothetical protein